MRVCESKHPLREAGDFFAFSKKKAPSHERACCSYTTAGTLPAYYVSCRLHSYQNPTIYASTAVEETAAGARCLSLWWALLAGAGQPCMSHVRGGVQAAREGMVRMGTNRGSTPQPGVAFEKFFDHRPFLNPPELQRLSAFQSIPDSLRSKDARVVKMDTSGVKNLSLIHI